MRKGLSYSECGKLGWEKSKEKLKQSNEKRRQDYQDSPNVCQECGKEIDYAHRHNRFCSKSCSAKHNNPLRKHKKGYYKRLTSDFYKNKKNIVYFVEN